MAAAGTKRALLIGCNYPGSDAELRGCVNDVMSMREMLTSFYGFQPANIKVMVDTDPSTEQPTGAGVKKAIGAIVSQSKGTDVLFIHFSGHGTQVTDHHQGEADMKDEAICPTDMNLITDDDLRILLKPLPPSVRLTVITDCCHSGGMLDHPVQQISGNKDPNAPPSGSSMDPTALLGMFFKGASGGARDIKNRALPQDLWSKLLSLKTGVPIDPSHPRSMLSSAFGNDASAKVVASAAGMLKKYVDGQAAAGGAQAGKMGLISKLLGMCMSATPTQGSAPAPGAAPTAGGATGGAAAGGPANNAGTGAEKKNAKGILITGCQAMETSADACPSGDPAKAFGALTNALTTTVKATKQQNPGANLTYKQLVTEVRELLHKSQFTQNPCLECKDTDADKPFIC